MKNLCLIFIFINLFVFKFYGQEVKISEADSLMNLGNSFYNSNPEMCISLLDKAAILFENLKKKKEQAYCYQNIAFAYNEKLEKFDSSIYFIEKSVPIWIELQDTLKHANLLKYYGMLQGKIGEFRKGKETIGKAINLFDKVGFKSGIAVSYYDLALLYESESQIDSCIFYLKKNKAYFETVNDTFRIFNSNNKLFEIYSKNNRIASASEIFESNLKLEHSSRVYWQQLIDYYRLSVDYFKLIENREFYDLYKEKYKQLYEKLIEQGLVVM